MITNRNFLVPKELENDKLYTFGDILDNEVFKLAEQAILDTYMPKHKMALFSFCTSQKPYSNSQKWVCFNNHFGDQVDFIVLGGAGVIPIEYETCYPYLLYNGKGERKLWIKYTQMLYERLSNFLDRFEGHWDKIAFSVIPKHIDYLIIDKIKRQGVLFPSEEVYREGLRNKTPGISVRRYPLCSKECIAELEAYFEISRAEQGKLF